METSYPLVVINSVNFTNLITVPNYTMVRKDVTKSWTDGNENEHEYIIRSRISGRFTAKPLTPEDYHLFNSTIEANKVTSGDKSGAILASLYINNLNTVVSGYFRFDYDPANVLPLMGSKDYEGFEVTVKEV